MAADDHVRDEEAQRVDEWVDEWEWIYAPVGRPIKVCLLFGCWWFYRGFTQSMLNVLWIIVQLRKFMARSMGWWSTLKAQLQPAFVMLSDLHCTGHRTQWYQIVSVPEFMFLALVLGLEVSSAFNKVRSILQWVIYSLTRSCPSFWVMFWVTRFCRTPMWWKSLKKTCAHELFSFLSELFSLKRKNGKCCTIVETWKSRIGLSHYRK